MVTLSGYLISSLLRCLYRLFQYSVIWCKWLARQFPRNAHSSSFLEYWPLRGSSLESHPHVESGLMCGWAFPPPQNWPTSFIPYSNLTPSTDTISNIFKLPLTHFKPIQFSLIFTRLIINTKYSY